MHQSTATSKFIQITERKEKEDDINQSLLEVGKPKIRHTNSILSVVFFNKKTDLSKRLNHMRFTFPSFTNFILA